MTSNDEQARAAIAAQASEWFVANDEAPLGGEDSAALVAWLKASPAHVEEFLGVASIARDLHRAGNSAESTVDALIALARAEEAGPALTLGSRVPGGVGDAPARGRPRPLALAAAAAGVAVLGSLLVWSLRPAPVAVSIEAPGLHFGTGHGEQQTYRLADGSLLHLNTDSAVTVRYSDKERLAVLTAGEADFEVAHQARAFRVQAGPATVIDLGTQFDVRLTPGATVVTVVDGRVAVLPGKGSGTGPGPELPPRPVELGADQQISVAEGRWPASAVTVDAKQATAWLHRQIAFDHEPLERVAAEFNRYSTKPVEISAPQLRQLEVSGVFSTDDPEEFIAFLRSLEGVRVEVSATKIRVSQK